jgi:hypothetical protein
VQYLVTAGGGSGGYNGGGGGGAGGVLQGLAQIASGTAYTITVGAGGAAITTSGPGPGIIGNAGGNSAFGSFATAIGGGYGNSGSGGSGGGGANTDAGGSGTIGQGYDGSAGTSDIATYGVGGGGGGYGQKGSIVTNSSTTPGANGGDGYTTYITNPSTYSWSNHFNGSTDYIYTSTTSTQFAFSGSFTMEGWFYFNIYGNQRLFSNAGNNEELVMTPGGIVTYYDGSSGHNASSAIPLNTWTHIAMVRNGIGSNNCQIFINGVSSTTFTSTTSVSTAVAQYIGHGPPSFGEGSLYYFQGYISNVRIVNGTAVYTSNFTPSTTPLTAISGTALLTCQAASFIDASSNNFTISTNGSPYIASQNPFGASYAGGGGGGGDYRGSHPAGYGGMGGGGAGLQTNGGTAGSGSTNTGSGGGGACYENSATITTGAGGSGIVILAYPSTFPAASSVTNGTLTTVGGYKIYTFLTSGSITF